MNADKYLKISFFQKEKSRRKLRLFLFQLKTINLYYLKVPSITEVDLQISYRYSYKALTLP